MARPTQRLIISLAARAECDRRTATAYLLGRDPRGSWLLARLEQAARELGVERVSAPTVTTTSAPPRAA